MGTGLAADCANLTCRFSECRTRWLPKSRWANQTIAGAAVEHRPRPWQFSLSELLAAVTAASIFFGSIALARFLGALVFAAVLGTLLVAVGLRLRSRRYLLGGLFTICMTIGLFFASLRHDLGNPTQNYDGFTAIRRIDVWYVAGQEIYAHNSLGVIVDSLASPPVDEWENVCHQVRWFGKRTPTSTDHFLLGEDLSEGVYTDAEKMMCLKFILRTKLESQEPNDRIWAISHLRESPVYPGHYSDVTLLLDDSNSRVRDVARQQLDIIDAESSR